MKELLRQLRADIVNRHYESALDNAKKYVALGHEAKYVDSLIRYCENKIRPAIGLYDLVPIEDIPSKREGALALIDIRKLDLSEYINGYSDVHKMPGGHLLTGRLSKVSIVIPVYNRNKILSMTLAAIVHQTYPLDLIEVIVVDDGSVLGTMEVIKTFEKLLDIKYFWHPDKGYRPGQARTAGMKLSSTENIITLDCDMLPTKNLVAEFMYVLNRCRDRVLIGPRRYVCTDHIHVDDLINSSYWIDTLPDVSTNNNVATGAWMGKKAVDWRHNFYRRTDFLKHSIFPFIAFASGNVAYPREAFLLTNGYDEEFEKWGSEDTEFGYRLFTKGYYMQPVMGALALHQEPPGGENEIDRKSGYVTTKDILKEKCPMYSRDYEVGRSYAVPKYSFINNSELSTAEFNKYINSFGYADMVIHSDLQTKFSEASLKEFLAIEKSAFIVVINKCIDFNIPMGIDTELKSLDQDILNIIKKLKDQYHGAFELIWRGQLERLVNFRSGE